MALRSVTIVLVALIFIASLSPQVTPSHAEKGSPYNYTITVPAVQEPDLTGILIKVDVEITPGGSGQVEVEAGGSVDDTTRYSLMQAAAIGALLAGYDWRMFDYRFVFENTSSIAGPSASAAAATSIYLALTRSPLLRTFSDNVTMTGAISPTGLYSAIGGVQSKCSAAASGGRIFLYPLANYRAVILGCNTTYYSIPGPFSVIEVLSGLKSNTSLFKIPMPKEFNTTMINASRYMRGEALKVLSTINATSLGGNASSLYSTVLEAVNESNATEQSHPYISASRAFYALYNAFYLEYLVSYLAPQGVQEGLLDKISREADSLLENLTMLEENLSMLPQEGSAYYIEFLGIAYARIASAEAELNQIDKLASVSPLGAISSLAYAKARIYSIKSWLWSALSVKGLEPYLSKGQVKSLASYAGDYAHIASDYSISIARYMIDMYKNEVDVALLERAIETLEATIAKGDSYIAKGNYIAALGFYREALSQSMNNIFSVVISNQSDREMIYKGYLDEITKLYNYEAESLLWRGLPPGLAPAYMDYAYYLWEKGQYETAVNIARSGLSSTLIWYLYLIIANSGTHQMTGEQTVEIPVPTHNMPSGGLEAVLAGLLGFAIAYAIVSILYQRALRSALY
ncbi:MAG: hypothetical protein F7C35_04680 [Desulfurococcales archaeon]|nr:hypothetical protein [Desulfurococcales archaeon]